MKLMNRWTAACVVALAAAAGCNSNAYSPNADTAHLVAYATTAKYPSGTASTPAKNISYSEADTKTITVINASDTTLTGVQLWVSRSFVIEIDQLPDHKTLSIAPDLIYNNGGSNLTTVAKESITNVQLVQGGQVMDVSGPVALP